MLTPSFASTLNPEDVPTLETLLLGGEALVRDNIETWYGRVKLINAYGPSKVCVDCVSHIVQSATESPTTIGRSQNVTCWIVDPNDHNRLAPIGCVGELLVQGPTLARGYLNDEQRTKASFIDNVKWLLPPDGQKYKFYKTGDLVRYNSDGTIEYLGRADSQIKLRGLRIELAEIEYNIRKAVSNVEHVTVDVIHRESGEMLTAFMTFGDRQIAMTNAGNDDLTEELLSLDDIMQKPLANIIDHLKVVLPVYMVPSLFLPLRHVPFGSSMKLDRKKLHEQAAMVSADKISVYAASQRSTFRAPTTELETSIRARWSRVLDLPEESISVDDDFYYLGGDSIRVITMGRLLQKEYGIQLGLSLSARGNCNYCVFLV
jgi:acyl-CoA synthetase (AMP-forming)/AMP-acid ligase II/acyl carrier protein